MFSTNHGCFCTAFCGYRTNDTIFGMMLGMNITIPYQIYLKLGWKAGWSVGSSQKLLAHNGDQL